MLRDNLIAAIRTGCAALGTFIIAWLVSKTGFEIDPQYSVTLGVLLFTVAMAAYNFAVNLLAEKVHPYFGVLLGIPRVPSYSTGTVTGTVTDTVPDDERG